MIYIYNKNIKAQKNTNCGALFSFQLHEKASSVHLVGCLCSVIMRKLIPLCYASRRVLVIQSSRVDLLNLAREQYQWEQRFGPAMKSKESGLWFCSGQGGQLSVEIMHPKIVSAIP